MANWNRSAEKEAFWRLVLDEHARSGLTAREFCRRESLSEPSFYSWRRKVRDRDNVTGDRELVPVTVVRDEPPSQGCAKDFPLEIAAGGIVIGVNNSCSTETMCRVLTAVRQSANVDSPC